MSLLHANSNFTWLYVAVATLIETLSFGQWVEWISYNTQGIPFISTESRRFLRYEVRVRLFKENLGKVEGGCQGSTDLKN